MKRFGLIVFLGFGGFALAEEAKILGFLDRHCLECHDNQKSEGDLNLLELEFDPDNAVNRTLWIRIHNRIAEGEMPPPEKIKDLSEADRKQFVATLAAPLHRSDLAEVVAEGRGPLRRLTRVEYEARLRDLLALPHLDIRDKLPADRDTHGFTRVTRLLDLSRVQLEAWIDAAESALRSAVATGVDPIPVKTWRFTGTELFPSLETYGEREAMFFAKDGAMVKIDGETFKSMTPEQRRDPELEMALFRSATWPYYGYPRGFVAPHDGDYLVRFSGRAVRQVPDFRLVPAHEPLAMSFRSRQPSGPDVSGDVRETGGWMDLMPEAGEFETTIRLRRGETFEYSPLGLPVPFIRTDGGFYYDFPPMPTEGHPGVAIRWLEVEGPVAGVEWPPLSHRVLFGDLPIRPAPSGSSLAVDVETVDPVAEARRLLRRFVDRAASSPVPDEALTSYHTLITDHLSGGTSFAEAMLKGYQAFLCSGHFLFLVEPGVAGDSRDPAVAARLSHFLWSTGPDGKLRELAEDGRLGDPAVLRAETDRLIDDARFERFVIDFTDQWLNLRQLRRDQSDDRLYPEYRKDDYLVDSMERETRTFFAAMVRENLPATTLVSSDFTFVNDRLARHYDLPRVSGSAMQRIDLPAGSPYGGILTQASVLKITSNGTTTSPVVRGVWVMERLLGDPPPPPPKSVPAIEPDIRGATTVRELLDKHTTEKSCAACHARFDPVGFALEGFDILGAWRDRYRGMEKGEKITGIDRAGHPFTYYVGHAIAGGGRLLDGREYGNVRDLKSLLAHDARALARNVLHQLTLYSTGTQVRFSDRVLVEGMLDRTAEEGYRVRDLLHELVASDVFRGRSELIEQDRVDE